MQVPHTQSRTLCLTCVACLIAGRPIHTNQYSVTEYFTKITKGSPMMPAVFFLYDLSPIQVIIKETRPGLLHFLVRVSAVVGGMFAVTGVLPSPT